MQQKPLLFYHLIALFCILVWGTTFVSTKILLNHGLTPTVIFFYRFLLAYVLMWFVSPKTLFSKSLKDEFLFLLLGISGGSIYFFTENTALEIAYVNNVALLVCTAPLLTALLSHFFLKNEKFSKRLLIGSLLALAGVALVIFNGKFVLKSNPLGDFLSLSAALSWAIYTIILKKLDTKYSIAFITRKVFFYGLLTIVPFLAFSGFELHFDAIFTPVVAGNLLFLGIVASMLCFVLWNVALKHLGSVRTSNYIYFNPLVTLITAALVLNEIITPIAAVGAVLILAGLFFAENNFSFKKIVNQK
ncbi:MAG: DMT family transporter [Prevotellaceae bacterium]|jgi:drug/metabolite transporter (DMT)-like permease|nr:DMT family transporter [Prevotellaceae bacterium]